MGHGITAFLAVSNRNWHAFQAETWSRAHKTSVTQRESHHIGVFWAQDTIGKIRFSLLPAPTP